ncbi:siderophore biosynthesis protein-like protein [Hyaloscypha variabilis F]|uniref:Siderophore biosynthesis protein-like protein n=1 Tax=Hyaloscypha variabilis (strain UAMH 11265 / GT02V1 / F) TaxID=1149755 RepID=A0A2J6R8T7_HYAVF|nr:siderophore biosynthesis protein-like protein [Hyaloscypha variabilis F]
MAPTPNIVHLPNGQNLTVLPVFGGFFFKSNELNLHGSVFPAGWTVILQSEDYSDEHEAERETGEAELSGMPKERKRHIHPFKRPTLHNDNLFISSISNPSSHDFKSPTSPTRQIAMMLWATLYWYFHQPAPSPYLTTEASKHTPDAGKPRGDWRINIKREGVLRGRNLIQKLERMGLITSDDSSVGINVEENTPEGWSEMFISKRTFWQLSAKLFLFTLTPTNGSSFPGSPYGSRPSSPVRGEQKRNSSPNHRDSGDHSAATQAINSGLWSPGTAGPFSSGSHLPTYFPPPPLQYTLTSGIRHPMRPKPPRQGEIFYTRFVPSVGQYLSFRCASLSPKPVAYNGPSSSTSSLNPPKQHQPTTSLSSLPTHISVAAIADLTPPSPQNESQDTLMMTDLQLLNKWMNIDRVSKFWGCSGPQAVQEKFLQTNLTSKHSFPAIGLWDGKPFGYFEIYWVKEDILGRHLGNEAGDYDRGVHVLVGEDEFRGKHRVKCWITGLAHWAFVQDYRTDAVVLEPRVDNERFISTLIETGFLKEGEVTLPHKQSAFVKLRRENFEAPEL